MEDSMPRGQKEPKTQREWDAPLTNGEVARIFVPSKVSKKDFEFIRQIIDLAEMAEFDDSEPDAPQSET
jgi:hypothetical protein